jgi:hypothetical protein
MRSRLERRAFIGVDATEAVVAQRREADVHQAVVAAEVLEVVGAPLVAVIGSRVLRRASSG